ncbi:Zinc finger MYM-type protein 1 [Glycine max]|nr:Zinc finger MYM-type protein 1 [Glycine max]
MADPRVSQGGQIMNRFLKRKLPSNEQQSSSKSYESSLQQQRIEINLEDFPLDLGKRIKILAYYPNDRDKIRRAYLQRGPCQPTLHNFSQRKIGKSLRRFCPSWFNEFGNWLEYSIEKDVAFCLCCYLFRHDFGKQSGGDTFVIEGFTNWNKKERLSSHVGGPNSAHNIAWRKCQDLMNQNQHIEVVISKQSEQVRDLYRRRLTVSIDCICFLLKQGLAFCGHDESTNSANQGNFLELLRFPAEHNESINHDVLENAPENHQLIAPKIQKDIVNAIALETTNAIITDLRDELFAIIVDEARDISNKEQMAIALRYVNKKGSIVERFFGMVHVKDITALSLKMAIDELFCKHGLNISRIRGQGYDSASNMQGEFSGLKSLILKENSSAFYVHCFVHQLQLTLVAVAKNHIQVASLFNLVSTLLNVVGGSCKRHDMLREKQINYVRKALGKGEIPSGQGLNQETSLKRAVDTRWGSHYATLINLILMYSSIVDVLEIIKEDGSNADQRAEANGLLHLLEDFDFAFTLHLMKNVLGISNELSQALQRKDQDIINAMNLVNITKL